MPENQKKSLYVYGDDQNSNYITLVYNKTTEHLPLEQALGEISKKVKGGYSLIYNRNLENTPVQKLPEKIFKEIQARQLYQGVLEKKSSSKDF